MTTPDSWARRSERESVTELPDLTVAPPPLDDAELESDQPVVSWATRARLATRAHLAALPLRLGWLSRKIPAWSWYLVRDAVVGFARVAAWLYSWLHMADERRAIAQMESRDAKARAKREVNRDARFRLIVVGVIAALALVAHLALWLWRSPDPILLAPGPHGWILVIEGLALLGLFEYVGHRQWDRDEDARRIGPLTHGTSSRTLRRDLEQGLAARKLPDAAVVGLTVNNFGWHGTIETEARLTDEIIEHLERWVHAPAGSLMVRTDSRNSASHPFRLLIADPLANSDTPDVPEGPLDIRRRQQVGRHLFGAKLLVNLRQHIGLIGRSGSGKSSGLWVLIDRITACSNARVAGIDLTNGPALPVWRRAIARRAFEPESAAELLSWAIELARSRNAELARLAETDDGDLDENWNPTDAAPAWYIVIDEFHVLADDKELLGQVKLLARIGRKACVFLVLATPGASREDMGSTIIKAMVGLKVMFACVQQDVTNFLGGRMLELGWRPDKLAPSAAGNARDAGKAFVWDGDHPDPEVVRVARLDPNQCRARAKARGGESWSAVPGVLPDSDVESVPGQARGQEGITPPVQEDALAFLGRVLDYHEGRDGVPTEWVLNHEGCRWSTVSLANELRVHEVRPARLGRSEDWSGNPKGYLRVDVEQALERRVSTDEPTY